MSGNPKCAECGKTVYVTEKLELLNKVWHKGCFRCATCKSTLTMKNYQAIGGLPYCRAHYPAPTATGTTRETSVGESSGDAGYSGGGYQPAEEQYQPQEGEYQEEYQ